MDKCVDVIRRTVQICCSKCLMFTYLPHAPVISLHIVRTLGNVDEYHLGQLQHRTEEGTVP